MKKKLLLIPALVLVIILSGCSSVAGKEGESYFDEFPTGTDVETIEISKNPTATVTMEDGNEFKIELYYYTAPNTVSDFIALTKAGVYDGMAFDVVKRDCMVMLASSDSTYKAPYYIKDEINDASSEHALSHKKGVVSMVSAGISSDKSTGRFFVLTKDQTYLDNNYTSFGVVTEGLEYFEKIAKAEKSDDGNLTAPLKIKTVKVDTNGNKFPLPTIILNK